MAIELDISHKMWKIGKDGWMTSVCTEIPLSGQARTYFVLACPAGYWLRDRGHDIIVHQSAHLDGSTKYYLEFDDMTLALLFKLIWL